MMRRVVTAAFLAACFVVPAPIRADIKLPSLFTDGLVLQQGDKVPVWGTAGPGEAITVTLEAKGETKAMPSPRTPRRAQRLTKTANGAWISPSRAYRRAGPTR